MTAFDLTVLRFLLASLACLAAGGSVWALSVLLRRYVPALAAQRSIWLLGQGLVVATFLMMLLPPGERVRLVPPIDIESANATVSQYFAPPPTPVALARPEPVAARDAGASARSWLSIAAQAWLAVYLLGLLITLGRLLYGQRQLNRLARAGQPLASWHGHPGFDSERARASRTLVVEVDAPISPMLLGPFQPRLLIPRHLRSFDPLQQQLIIEHELTHVRRHDLQWMAVGLVFQSLLWFNPFMRLLRSNLNWAQELGCDRDVLRHRPSGQRKAYAAALVAQLKLQFQASHSAMAFGGVDASKLSARVGLIRAPGNAEQNRWSRGVALCALAAVAALSIMLQPALAWNSGAESMALRCTELMEADSGKLLVRQGQCATRVTPASTFKIPTSLMGFDSGILKDEHTPKLPFHEGYADWVPAWRTDTDPASWMKNSVVWYSQLITAQLGVTRLQGYLRGFGYGNHDVSGDPGANNGLTLSWLNSSLQISPDEQVDFLRRMVKRELPVKAEAYDMTARIMKQETTANGWDIYGKTGTGAPVKADGKDDDAHAYGWFVGWASKGQRTIVFAYLNQDREEVDGAAGPRARDTFLREFRARLATL